MASLEQDLPRLRISFPEPVPRIRAMAVLYYLMNQQERSGYPSFDLFADPALAYLKQDWDERGVGVGNCQDVRREIPGLLSELTRANLIRKIETDGMVEYSALRE